MPAPRGIFVLFASFIFTAATAAAAMPPEPAANAVAWPASTGLVVAEVVTGGATASDEYVEIANAGLIEADLGGCEIVYATASGATVTRKATFAEPLLLEPECISWSPTPRASTGRLPTSRTAAGSRRTVER